MASIVQRLLTTQALHRLVLMLLPSVTFTPSP